MHPTHDDIQSPDGVVDTAWTMISTVKPREDCTNMVGWQAASIMMIPSCFG